MHRFHGNLLIGGLALRDVDGTMGGDDQSTTQLWAGQFEVGHEQGQLLQTGRQYLLMLEDGRNREVVLTDIRCRNESGSLVCLFEDCLSTVDSL